MWISRWLQNVAPWNNILNYGRWLEWQFLQTRWCNTDSLFLNLLIKEKYIYIYILLSEFIDSLWVGKGGHPASKSLPLIDESLVVPSDRQLLQTLYFPLDLFNVRVVGDVGPHLRGQVCHTAGQCHHMWLQSGKPLVDLPANINWL